MAGKMQRSLWFDQPITDADVLTVFEGENEWLTRRQIAIRLERVKSPSLTERIESLTNQGYLEKQGIPMPNGVTCFVYRRTVALGGENA